MIILLGRPGPDSAGHPTTTASESYLSSGRDAGGGHKVTQLVSDKQLRLSSSLTHTHTHTHSPTNVLGPLLNG